MARREVTGRKPIHVTAADHIDATACANFARATASARSSSISMKPLGLMPVTFRVGNRVMISREAAAAWRRAREAAEQAV